MAELTPERIAELRALFPGDYGNLGYRSWQGLLEPFTEGDVALTYVELATLLDTYEAHARLLREIETAPEHFGVFCSDVLWHAFPRRDEADSVVGNCEIKAVRILRMEDGK